MISLDDMAIFAAVVEANGFSAAAQLLEISTPVVSKRVSALEAQLGARLLNRTTRRLSLTEAGSVFYRHCSRVVSEAREAEAAVTYLNEVPRGLLRVTAPVTIGSQQVTHALVGFMARYPEVQVELDVSDRPVDLAEEGYDVAIRVTRNPPSLLAARLLTPTRRVVCAAPEYWHRRGRPQVPSDLADHECIVYLPNPDYNHWSFEGPDGVQSVAVGGRLKVNNTSAMLEAAAGGLGVVMLTSFLVDRALAAGQLEQVLHDYQSASPGIYALYLPNRYLSTKARVFIDYLVEWYEQNSVNCLSAQ
ncbi:LysR family transcriptional regulator [Marinobacterium sp. D7]|uniref:LysR family transcriptional regulator n=1 Tax=Marinobacterium ramblicola TaxID=2849041 RepID=UPI001C2D6D65|nr:LysR family transcriptional regulator [Marinobacterium ramblicola]MBV1788048.1 LysR family transcriptional regulator [Marinobacterium ramblicola]